MNRADQGYAKKMSQNDATLAAENLISLRFSRPVYCTSSTIPNLNAEGTNYSQVKAFVQGIVIDKPKTCKRLNANYF